MRQINYVTTHTGLKVIDQFYMSKFFWHKGNVWILSVVSGRALWSIHETGDEENKKSAYYGPKFKMDHEKQIQELNDQAEREDDQKKVLITVDDRSSESKTLLKQSARLQPGDIQN